MRATDALRLTAGAVTAQRKRSLLTVLSIAVGIAAVVLLTALGKGLQRFVLAEFTQFGTHLLAVVPGRATTLGISGAVLGTVRPLTVDDAAALRHVPGVLATSPLVMGNVKVEAGRRGRRTTVYGVGAALPEVWQFPVASGRFLPDEPGHMPRPLAVIGSRVHRELFPGRSPLGQRLRVAGDAYRVIGVMRSKGQMLGFDLNDAVYIPAERALALFDRNSLMEIDVLYQPGLDADRMAERIRRRLAARHGREDFTIITQEAFLDVLGDILGILTLAVGGIGGISLLVGAIGILTIMTIAVHERVPEIGLLMALGATRRQVRWLFLGEAVALATLGGVLGLALGAGGAWLIGALTPIPAHLSPGFTALAVLLAVAVGLLAGVLPAQRAARLDPVVALRGE